MGTVLFVMILLSWSGIEASSTPSEPLPPLYSFKPSDVYHLDSSVSVRFVVSLGKEYPTLRTVLACDNPLAELQIQLYVGDATYATAKVFMDGQAFVSHTFVDVPSPDNYEMEVSWLGTNETDAKVGDVQVVVMIEKRTSAAKGDLLPGGEGVILGTGLVGLPVINYTSSILELSWWPTVSADTYHIYALPKPCGMSMTANLPQVLWTNATLIWTEVSTNFPDDQPITRQILWTTTQIQQPTVCINIIAAKSAGSGSSSLPSTATAYCAVNVKDSSYRGPSTGLWAAIGVVIGFIIITGIGVMVYLHIRKRDEEFEYAM